MQASATHREAYELDAPVVLDDPFGLRIFRKEVERCVFS